VLPCREPICCFARAVQDALTRFQLHERGDARLLRQPSPMLLGRAKELFDDPDLRPPVPVAIIATEGLSRRSVPRGFLNRRLALDTARHTPKGDGAEAART
jgi:hypothetical protein